MLITGARAPVAVDLARAFSAAGYETHLADSVAGWAARMSRGTATAAWMSTVLPSSSSS